jgi:nitrilase
MPTVAVVQAGTVLKNPAQTLATLQRLCADCALRGAKLAVFPEAYIGGYPKGLGFGATVGIRTEAGRELFREYADGAITVPGPVTEAVGRIAKSNSLTLIIGVVERDGGTLYCTVLYFGPDGSLLGKHRKLVPTATERLIWGCGDSSTLEVFSSELGRIGALVCWENYMPLARMAMYAQGVELYCAPTVDDREIWIPTVRHIAREGHCFVLSACQYLTRECYPSEWLERTDDLPATPIRGGSCIIGPLGDILAGPIYDEEAVVVADVDTAKLMGAKFDFDVVGHYARPDVFSFGLKPLEGNN